MDRKIITTFEELLERNRTLFQLFERRGLGGFLKALWNARQPEIEELKKRTEELAQELIRKEAHIFQRNESILNLEKVSLQREKSIEELEARLSLLLSEGEVMEQKIERLEEEAREEKKWQEACKKLETMLAEKIRQVKEQSHLCQNLERELADAQAYIRTQKILNKQMRDELLRLTRTPEAPSGQQKDDFVNQL